MPPTMSDQQAELRRKARRRLIGAFILVALLVIFLPMVLDHEPKPIGADVPVRMPQAEPAATVTQTVASTAPSPVPEADPTPQPEISAPPPPSNDPAPSPAQPVAQPEPERAEAPRARSKPAAVAAASSAGGFVVQVGAFSNAGKAAQAQRKVAAAGLPVFTETVAVGGQERIRVRAGPFEQRAQAEAALEKLSEIGFGGKLMMK